MGSLEAIREEFMTAVGNAIPISKVCVKNRQIIIRIIKICYIFKHHDYMIIYNI